MTPIVGYVVPWDTPSSVITDDRGQRHRLIAERGCCDRWLALNLGAPLLLGHQPIYTTQGVHQQVGTATAWRPDTFGLLARCQVDDDPIGASVIDAVNRGWLWGFSVGWMTSAEIPTYSSPLVIPTVRMAEAGIGEVSLTDRPGFGPDVRILAVGDEAEWLWDYPDLADVAHAAKQMT